MPIIFLTGHGDVAMTVQAMKAGAVEFLTKPFRPEMLVSAIRDAFERSAAGPGPGGGDEVAPRVLRVAEPPRTSDGPVVAGLLNKQVGASSVSVRSR